jgi:hypothetical protein
VTALALVPWHAEAPGQVVAAAAVVAAVVVIAVVVAVVGMVGRVGQRAAAVVGRRRDEEIAPGPHHGAAQKSRGVFRRRVALYQNRLAGAVAQAAFCTKKNICKAYLEGGQRPISTDFRELSLRLRSGHKKNICKAYFEGG